MHLQLGRFLCILLVLVAKIELAFFEHGRGIVQGHVLFVLPNSYQADDPVLDFRLALMMLLA